MTESFLALIVFGLLFVIAVVGLISSNAAAARHNPSGHPNDPDLHRQPLRQDRTFGVADRV